MKLTNKQILNCIDTLSVLSNKDLPVKVSYLIAKNITKIENELIIYNKEKQKLIDKYCVKDENNQLTIADENLECWSNATNDLLDIELDIDIHKIKLEDLINCNCELKPSELILIDYMIEE